MLSHHNLESEEIIIVCKLTKSDLLREVKNRVCVYSPGDRVWSPFFGISESRWHCLE